VEEKGCEHVAILDGQASCVWGSSSQL